MPHRGETRGREGPGGHRDWSDVAISQEMPAAAPAGWLKKGLPLDPWMKGWSCPYSDFSLLVSRTVTE